MEMQNAKGVKDLPPEEKILKNKVVNTISRAFELYGFAPLETPILERFETLAAKFGAGIESDALKETFKLKDQGDRQLGLRFEMTTSLARFVAQNPTLKMPFKVYQAGPVFRDGPIKTGREREFWQADADTIGASSMLAEAEQIGLLSEVFRQLDFKFVIKVNNRKILNGILKQAGISEVKEALIAIDKLDKIGKAGVAEEFKQRGYSKGQTDKVFALLTKGATLASLKKKLKDAEGTQGLAELEELFGYLKVMKIKEIEFDLSLARGQAYYTGTVIEVYLKNSEVTSSIAGGGRYDNMIGSFMGGGREIPAVGISFGITPIMEQMKAQNKLEEKTPAKVLMIPINVVDETLKIAQELRANGIAADFAMGKKGVSKNLEYANVLKIPYVAIVGEEELKKKKILLKEMSSGTEQLLSLKDLIKKLQK
ncbi:MAG TPA: histidine--tRNA ligase [Candidatus Nanoarchaeia archaeon]|nr:histidine--tRNA ligase [Candidatus Nanoarchaeia archaeon]